MNKKIIFNFLELNPVDSRAADIIADKFRKRYIEHLAALGEGNENNLYWWTLNFACRNTLISPLFKNVCYLILLKDKLEKGQIINEVIVDSFGLKKVLQKYKTAGKLNFKITYKGKNFLCLFILRFYSYFKTAINFFLRWFFGWVTRKYSKKSIFNKDIILIDTFVYKNSFTGNIFNDRYYPSLKEYVSSNEKKYIYYIPTYFGIWKYKELFKNLRKSKNSFILKEDYLRIIDYFIVLSPLRKLINVDKKSFEGFDISSLIREEISNDKVSNSSINGVLNYRFVKRLKDGGIKVRTFINWFENQSIDHGYNMGFRENYPEADLVGYLGFPPQNNYLSLYPTEQERLFKVIPKEIKVIGSGYIGAAKQFCPELTVKVAPAFRHSNIWNDRKIYPEKDKFVILIALPIIAVESDEMIGLVLDSIKSIGIDNLFIQIKPHPTQDLRILKDKWLDSTIPNLDFVSGDFNSCVESANILISCTSSACLETIAKEIPVIVIASKSGLTQLVIPGEVKQDIWKLCYSVEDVRKAILFYINKENDNKRDYREIGREVRKKYFEPVTKKSVRNFLGL